MSTDRYDLIAELEKARGYLLRAAACLPAQRWSERPSPAYSPAGWHIGHVATMQARWLLPGHEMGERFGGFFDPLRTGKEVRGELPGPEQLRTYLDDVLHGVRERLRAGHVPAADGLPHAYLVHHMAQHELQHAEHLHVIAALCERRLQRGPRAIAPCEPPRLDFPRGLDVQLGNDDPAEAYDNERPPRAAHVAPFWIDAAPATARDFGRFIERGGYREARFWTAEGWGWRSEHSVEMPLGWLDALPDAPVTCISWYEADAYARWRGGRLPTEEEWEAARRAGMPGWGEVWEWTSSWFAPYPGFRAYPYDEYSSRWFGTHKVLRGGSWATHPRLERPSFRNWYEPGFREIPAGLRCAGGL
jgi:ergothioneine biosynthesis protein EgtB